MKHSRFYSLSLFIFMLLALGCDSPRLTLLVNVVTNLHAERDFSSFRVSVSAAGGAALAAPVEAAAPVGGDLSLGFVAAQFDRLPIGTIVAQVELFDVSGAVVGQAETLIDAEVDTAVTLVISAACLGVQCDLDSELSVCVGGRCVSPSCAEGLVEACERPAMPLGQIAPALGSNICTMLDRCGQQTVKSSADHESCASWAEALAEDFLLPKWQASITAGDLIYHPEHATACVDAVLATCTSFEFNKQHLECARAFQGVSAIGERCQSDFDCIGIDTFCDRGESCPGVCAVRGRSGDACIRDSECEVGLQCERRVCSLPRAERESCNSELGCLEGLLCTTRDVCVNREAYFSGAEEASCGGGENLCAPGLSCLFETADGACGRAVADGPCWPGFPDPCPPLYYCDAILRSGEPGLCRPMPTTGEACISLPNLGSCSVGYGCRADGLCAEQRRLGQTCDRDPDCYSQQCISGVCQSVCD